MASAPIIFGAIQESGEAELAGASPLAINVLVDGKGAVRRRPVLMAWDGFPAAIPEDSQIDGLSASTSAPGTIYWVNALRKVWQVTAAVPSVVSDTTSAATLLENSGRPVLADTPYRLVIAGGGAPQSVIYSGGTHASARLGGSPPSSTHIVALGARLISDDLTSSATSNMIRISGSGSTGNETWDVLNFVSAEARPDRIVALRENTNEVFAFGETTLQVFSADAIAILAPGRTLNIGCSAPYSVIRVDEEFAWLDEQRQFVVSDGRSRQVISDAIAETLDNIETVSDCFGYRVNIGQFDCLVWQFPTDGRAFCYLREGGWSQWQAWTNGYGYSAMPVTSHYYWPSQNLHLAGLNDGTIVQFSTSSHSDVTGTCKAEVWTGFQNRQTNARKDCESVRLVFKRGQSATAAKAYLSWRDDLGDFCSPLELDLGATGDYMPTVERRTLGVYRQRQWKLEMTDAADLTLASVEESFSVLPN